MPTYHVSLAYYLKQELRVSVRGKEDEVNGV